jgi:DeoR/GlpR family transcriptional regulator of sugar metabolism
MGRQGQKIRHTGADLEWSSRHSNTVDKQIGCRFVHYPEHRLPPHGRLFAEEKRHIGLVAAELIADGETIALTPGTTATQVARSIRHRKGITVVTNAVNMAIGLSNRDDLTVFVTGGFLRGMWFSLVGPTGMNAVGELQFLQDFASQQRARSGLVVKMRAQRAARRGAVINCSEPLMTLANNLPESTVTESQWLQPKVSVTATESQRLHKL